MIQVFLVHYINPNVSIKMVCKCRDIVDRVKMITDTTPVSELKDLVDLISETGICLRGCGTFYKNYVNETMCWAVPSEKSLQFIIDNIDPAARLVDMGSGSGLWSRLIASYGIDVLPVDTIDRWSTGCTFVNPTVDYVQKPEDVLLMAWGSTYDPVQQFIDRGGKTIIIQGEHMDGCTVPYDICPEGWTCTSMENGLPSMASRYAEGIACYKLE